MKISDLMTYHDCKIEKSCLKNWIFNCDPLKWENNGIPARTQAVLQVKTKGKLKADLQALTA